MVEYLEKILGELHEHCDHLRRPLKLLRRKLSTVKQFRVTAEPWAALDAERPVNSGLAPHAKRS